MIDAHFVIGMWGLLCGSTVLCFYHHQYKWEKHHRILEQLDNNYWAWTPENHSNKHLRVARYTYIDFMNGLDKPQFL